MGGRTEMENFPMNTEETRMRSALEGYLRSTVTVGSDARRESHLDQDTLSAFTEGSLTKRESTPVVRHLVECSFCRNVTAELVRLDLSLAEYDQPVAVAADPEPASIASVLNGLLSRIFGTTDGAVFAHNEDEKKDEKPDEDNSPDQP